MKEEQEGNLVIAVPQKANIRKFDEEDIHQLQHCMKAVDFVIEWEDRYWFVEFKDPQDPNARPTDQRKFVKQFRGENLDRDLQYKYRDSFLYEWAAGGAHKPIYYMVVIALDALTPAELLVRSDALRRKIPVKGAGASMWQRSLVTDCQVFNLETWNQYVTVAPIRRVSA